MRSCHKAEGKAIPRLSVFTPPHTHQGTRTHIRHRQCQIRVNPIIRYLSCHFSGLGRVRILSVLLNLQLVVGYSYQAKEYWEVFLLPSYTTTPKYGSSVHRSADGYIGSLELCAKAGTILEVNS